VTKLDSSAAWASAAGMVSANRDVLLAIAGVFFLLPSLVAAVFVPAPVFATGMSEQQMLAALQAYYASSGASLAFTCFDGGHVDDAGGHA
jgi:hypothetical protein